MGREFLPLFNEWANSYDDTISGSDKEYRTVFERYDEILEEVANQAEGNVLEFGVGTGNLSKKIIEKGQELIGIEPSVAMRKIVNEKYPSIQVLDGDFLEFPTISETINSIVSTYAFHHLTDLEKEDAIRKYASLLPSHGKIIFADTVFETEKAKQDMIEDAMKKEYHRLANDLKSEYYTTIEVLRQIFNRNHFDVTFEKMNDFVWLFIATKHDQVRGK
ncbi:class I SAM-dependent DNA methyltransferase [Oceanobacillus caeni]|uniref:class I SAM-dependent DNA methyltransferase n=1 Tax=Oceanobacillus caeni TaxID=405946 RepID=UPI00363C8816